jgi:hypothetical protein
MGFSYMAIGDDLDELARHSTTCFRCYHRGLRSSFPNTLVGPPDPVSKAIEDLAATGIDCLMLFPLIADLDQLNQLEDKILSRRLNTQD